MMTKKEHIEFWLTQADDDWSAVHTLLKGRNYLQALFFAHLVIEKICKALWVKHNEKNVPPKTHNLLHLLSTIPITLDNEKSKFLLKLNRFHPYKIYFLRPDGTRMQELIHVLFPNDRDKM